MREEAASQSSRAMRTPPRSMSHQTRTLAPAARANSQVQREPGDAFGQVLLLRSLTVPVRVRYREQSRFHGGSWNAASG